MGTLLELSFFNMGRLETSYNEPFSLKDEDEKLLVPCWPGINLKSWYAFIRVLVSCAILKLLPLPPEGKNAPIPLI